MNRCRGNKLLFALFIIPALLIAWFSVSIKEVVRLHIVKVSWRFGVLFPQILNLSYEWRLVISLSEKKVRFPLNTKISGPQGRPGWTFRRREKILVLRRFEP